MAAIQKTFAGGKSLAKLHTALSFGAYNKAYKPNRTDFDWISRDEIEVDKYVNDPLCGGTFTASFFSNLMEGVKSCHTPSMMTAMNRDVPIYMYCGSEDPAVKARKAHMDLYAFNLGTLGAMAKGSVDFDAAAAQAAADNLVALTSVNQMAYWLPGTSNADMEGTRALPAIWAEGSDVGDKAKALVDAAMAMQAGAGSLDGVRGAMGAVGGACGGCHKAYRAPDS